MMKILTGFIVLIIFGAYLTKDSSKSYKPMFFSMNQEYQLVHQAQNIAILEDLKNEGLIQHKIELLSDENNNPLLYYAKIKTPVCIDGLCKPVHVEIYWNLLGNYVGYGISKKFPLTKFDHEEFERNDYLKLHQLLLDQHSILERRKLEDLFDTNAQAKEQIKYRGKKLDAVSGATKKEIKASLVEGALYSCYTLWHLAQGSVKDTIQHHLNSIYTNDLQRQFLYSPYSDYRFYALKTSKPTDYERDINQIIEIFKTEKPLIRTYILKKLPRGLWAKENISNRLYSLFSSVDIQSKTYLIKKLKDADHISLELLSTQIESMSKNQLKLYLKYLQTHPQKTNHKIKENLERMVNSGTYPYSYLILPFFEE